MKTILTSTFLGAFALALPALAEQATECVKADACITQVADANAATLKQVSDKVAAQPSTAGEVVKQTIIDTKASSELLLQIVKAAVVAAPEQAEAIRKVAVTLAPDAEEEIELVIASVLQGDQVAAENSDAANAAQDQKKNASIEPEGDEPGKNTVWLTNKGALMDGVTDANRLASKVQDTAQSPNQNHNAGGSPYGGSQGGGTVVIKPVTNNAVVPPLP